MDWNHKLLPLQAQTLLENCLSIFVINRKEMDVSEWIDWNGGECPVGAEDMVYVRMREGSVEYHAERASTYGWTHYGDLGDIIAYRLHKPDYEAEGRMKPETAGTTALHRTVTVSDVKNNALNEQVAGSHYKDMPIQPVAFAHANGLPFIEGSVVKYTVRHKSKNGIEDVKKAIHFLKLLAKLEYGEDL